MQLLSLESLSRSLSCALGERVVGVVLRACLVALCWRISHAFFFFQVERVARVTSGIVRKHTLLNNLVNEFDRVWLYALCGCAPVSAMEIY